MKLNKLDKEIMVNAIRLDMPEFEHAKKLKELFSEMVLEIIPNEIRHLLSNKTLTPYLNTCSGFIYLHDDKIWLSGSDWRKNRYFCIGIVISPLFRNYNENYEKFNKKLKLQIIDLLNKYNTFCDASEKAISDLENTLSVITTYKQLESTLPEFKKYFPDYRGPSQTPNLPAKISNIVADLNAIGFKWTESQSKATA